MNANIRPFKVTVENGEPVQTTKCAILGKPIVSRRTVNHSLAKRHGGDAN